VYSKLSGLYFSNVVAKRDFAGKIDKLVIPINHLAHSKSPKTFLLGVKPFIHKRKVFVIKLEVCVGCVIVFDFDDRYDSQLKVKQEAVRLGIVNNPGRG